MATRAATSFANAAYACSSVRPVAAHDGQCRMPTAMRGALDACIVAAARCLLLFDGDDDDDCTFMCLMCSDAQALACHGMRANGDFPLRAR